ncbi:MAG: molybdopterin-dependent oxidoreductase [Deltaproteobacteria bacterium]|nr:molybdopterin-dependent oxidoreductase [Deltaproteobacteria bacterium]
MLEQRRTLCNRDCPDACGIVAFVEDGRITRLTGDPDHPMTRGFLCWRTGHFLSLQYSPERITTPLLRVGAGEFRPIGWDQALDLAAEKLVTIRRESGPEAIFHYRSGGSLGLLKHLCDYFFELFGPVTVKRGDICSGAGDAAQLADFGEVDSHDVFDLLNSKNILLWGKNAFVSSPHLVPILKEARARGARLVLIDPAYHRTASLCEKFIQPRPGGDFALAMAIAQVLFERGLVDPRAAETCDNVDAFWKMVRAKPIEEWCEEADVPPACAAALAERLGDGPTAILVGWGMGRRANGSGIVRALDALSAVSGNLGNPGGGVSFYYKRRGAFDTSFIKGKAVAPRTVLEPFFGREVMAPCDPPIRMVWVTAGNPVTMLPESDTTAEALRTREFVVVCDSFLTDTARTAHLILPTTTLLEADDLLGSYGHHTIGVAQPVVPPPPGVKSDLEIMQALAARVGLGEALAGDARSWKRRMIKPEVVERGVTLDVLEKASTRNPIPPRVLFADGKVATPSGRVNLVTSPAAPATRDPAFPLCLLALSTARSQCSLWSEPERDPITAVVHPEAASGIPDGALARLESAISGIVVRVHHDTRQRRDVVVVPKGGHLSQGRCANRLIRARTTDAGEGGALYDEGVRLVPLG